MNEKRKAPRVEKNLPIKFSDCEYDILTETKNISSSGAYCSVNKPLELMTKLTVVILIPIKKNKTKIIKKINCCGVVVRREHIAEDNGKHPYRMAVYFSDLKEQDRKILRSYVSSHLPD